MCKISSIHTDLSVSMSVRVCVSVCALQSVAPVYLSENQNVKYDVCRFWHFPSNGVIAKIVRRCLDLLFDGKKIIFSISETVRAIAKCMGDICTFWHLPWNGVIEKIVVCDLNPLFKGQKLKNLFVSETVRAIAKMCGVFCYCDICHRMMSLLKLFSVNFLFEGEHYKILETVRASAKMHRTTFIYLDICQRIIPLRCLHIMTLTYLFKGKKSDILLSWKQWELEQTCEITLSIWRSSNISVFYGANDH